MKASPTVAIDGAHYLVAAAHGVAIARAVDVAPTLPCGAAK
jgi:hypothetical protein